MLIVFLVGLVIVKEFEIVGQFLKDVVCKDSKESSYEEQRVIFFMVSDIDSLDSLDMLLKIDQDIEVYVSEEFDKLVDVIDVGLFL